MNPGYDYALAWLLFTFFCLVLSLHIIENKKLKTYLRQQCKPDPAKQILRLSWSRSIQLLAVMGFSFILITLYSQQVNDKQEHINSFQDLIITGNHSNSRHDGTGNNSYHNLTGTDNGATFQPPATQASPPPAREDTIQDIFRVEAGSDIKATIDDIKSRYEELLVTYLVMEKCDKAETSDYQLIMSALQKEVTTAQAPIRLQDDIITAAKGSYEELYYNSDCQNPDIDDAATQYNAYINKLASHGK